MTSEPLSEVELQRIKKAFAYLRSEHGKALIAAGWTREVVFGGLDPLVAETVEGLPGVMAMILVGWWITEIKPDMLVFELDGRKRAWLRGGGLLEGDALEDYHERAAVREFDGGHPRKEAEKLAVIDMREILKI